MPQRTKSKCSTLRKGARGRISDDGRPFVADDADNMQEEEERRARIQALAAAEEEAKRAGDPYLSYLYSARTEATEKREVADGGLGVLQSESQVDRI